MAIVKILQYPDPRLGRVAKPVTEFNAEIKQMIIDMWDTYNNAKNCAALACTQLDFDDPYQISVIHYTPYVKEPLTIVNPEIIERSDETLQNLEACMSVSGAYAKVKRSKWVKVKALDRDGNPFEIEGEGELAKCFQHEIDHLHGKIFIDHLSRLKRQREETKIKKHKRWQEDQGE